MSNLCKKIILVSCLLVASCAGKPAETYCPAMSVVPDGAFVMKYEEGTNKYFSQAAIKNQKGYCGEESQVLSIWGSFDLHAALGEKATQTMMVPFDYFIAVLDDENNVLIKKNYTKNIKFKKKQYVKKEKVKFNEILDLYDIEDLYKYNILLSFQLTEEELEENRDNNNPY